MKKRFTLKTQNGFFARLGRQRLSYDDQRVMGADDWAMIAKTHDALKLGYEGRVHKVHLLLAFNQNDENLEAGYSFMQGTETMTRLKRTSENNRLNWAWLMIVVNPELFRIHK